MATYDGYRNYEQYSNAMAAAANPAPVTPAFTTVDERTKIREGLGLPPYVNPNPPAGTDLGYEMSADGLQQRKKFADGKGGFTYGSWELAPPKPGDIDALAAAKDKILADILTSYGLANVAATVAKIRLAYPKASSEDVLFILKNDPAYNSEYLTRFAGNAALKKAGKPTLSDAQYLQAETEYGKIFTAYGATSLANQSYYATLIGNSMDAVDVTNRMNQAYSVLKNSPQIKEAFNTFYKSVTDGDILAVILDKDTQLPILQQKITAAEIGGAALSQGLETSLARAEDLRGYGVTGAMAQTGYQTVAKKLPRGTFLSEISPETGVKYTQATAEDIQFKKNAEAQRQEDILVGTEIGRFGGSAGRLASKSRAQGLV